MSRVSVLGLLLALTCTATPAFARDACRFDSAHTELVCPQGTYPCVEKARGDLAASSRGEERAYWCRDWTEDAVLTENPGSYAILVSARGQVLWSSGDQYLSTVRITTVAATVVVSAVYRGHIMTWVLVDGALAFSTPEREFMLTLPYLQGDPPGIRTCSAVWAWEGTRYRLVRQRRPASQCVPQEDVDD